jgi:hypothetical protein
VAAIIDVVSSETVDECSVAFDRLQEALEPGGDCRRSSRRRSIRLWRSLDERAGRRFCPAPAAASREPGHRLGCENADGYAVTWTMGLEPGQIIRPPPTTCPTLSFEFVSVCVVDPLVLPRTTTAWR